VALEPSTGDILAMVGGANYRAQHLQPRGAEPAPAWLGLQAAGLCGGAVPNGYSPVSVLTNLRHVSAPGDPEWSPHSEGEQQDELTLRAALLESNNPAAAICSSASARARS